MILADVQGKSIASMLQLQGKKVTAKPVEKSIYLQVSEQGGIGQGQAG